MFPKRFKQNNLADRQLDSEMPHTSELYSIASVKKVAIEAGPAIAPKSYQPSLVPENRLV
jgi:hypothetical protein